MPRFVVWECDECGATFAEQSGTLTDGGWHRADVLTEGVRGISRREVYGCSLMHLARALERIDEQTVNVEITRR